LGDAEMIIEVNKLVNQALHVEQPVSMGKGREPVEGVSYVRDVDVDFTLLAKGKEVKLAGTFSAGLKLTCHRCLGEYELALEQDLDLVFIPREEMPGEVDVELADEDMNVASYIDVIDLAQIIDEQVALALPMKLLCSEDCKGICSQCGQNLNEGACQCRDERVDARLLVLKDIKEKMFGGEGGRDIPERAKKSDS
jgi:uncharacterized protein